MFKRLKKKIKNKLNNYLDAKFDKNVDDIRRLIKASIINRETFGPYKDYCKGKKLVICGAGPSLNKYKPIHGAIHIALNRAFLFDKVHFDFIFCMDFGGLVNYQNELKKYPSCAKLIGDYANNTTSLPQAIEESVLGKDVKRWVLCKTNDINDYSKMYFEKDIDTTNLCDFPQVGLAVLQFACFMNPTDIYLVGYDQSGGHFTTMNLNKIQSEYDKNNSNNWFKSTNRCQKECWKKFIEFKNYHYPSIKMHSINPIGLKGLFEDINY